MEKAEKFAVRFKTVQTKDDFVRVFQECQKKLDSSSASASPSKGVVVTPSSSSQEPKVSGQIQQGTVVLVPRKARVSVSAITGF